MCAGVRYVVQTKRGVIGNNKLNTECEGNIKTCLPLFSIVCTMNIIIVIIIMIHDKHQSVRNASAKFCTIKRNMLR